MSSASKITTSFSSMFGTLKEGSDFVAIRVIVYFTCLQVDYELSKNGVRNNPYDFLFHTIFFNKNLVATVILIQLFYKVFYFHFFHSTSITGGFISIVGNNTSI